MTRSAKARSYCKDRVDLIGQGENKADLLGSERSSDSNESTKKWQKRMSEGWKMSRMNRLKCLMLVAE
jgi:hypothetical protein